MERRQVIGLIVAPVTAAGVAMFAVSWAPAAAAYATALRIGAVACVGISAGVWLCLLLTAEQKVAAGNAARSPKRLKPADYMGVPEAALYIVTKTKALNPALDQDQQLHAAAAFLREALAAGEIPTQGRPAGQISFDDLSPEFWKIAAVVHDPRSPQLFRVTNYSDPSPAQEAIVNAYDAFHLERRAVRKRWKPKGP
jgi:hypothetical protein